MGVTRAAAIVLALGACSSRASKAGEDAKHPTTAGSDAPAAITPAVPAAGDAAALRGSDAAAPRAALGDAQIRVAWPKVTAAHRASPGATPCGTPRAPFVAPSTTFGIGDVFVIIDGASVPAEARVRLADCALAPRVAIGAALVLDTAADHPVTATLRKRGELGHLDALAAGTAVPIHLPIAGHAVRAALEPDAVYELTTDDKPPETAWIVAGHAAITDANGVVLVKDLAPGAHAVTAWLPPRAGQPARRATGEVTVVADDLAELNLSLD